MPEVEMMRISDIMYKEISQNLAVRIIPPIDTTGKCAIVGKYVGDSIISMNLEEQERAKITGFALCKLSDECDCPICV